MNRDEIINNKSNLHSANLRWADLSSADLRSANLRWADLSSADLRSANLRWADLRSANLHLADLRSANLRWADLSSADLRSANLHLADLHSANLRWADLSSADLRSANLRWADLRWADLRWANMAGCKGVNYFQCQFPNYGEGGKQFLAVEIDEVIWCFVGCFNGTEKQYVEYCRKDFSNNSEKEIYISRMKMLNFALENQFNRETHEL